MSACSTIRKWVGKVEGTAIQLQYYSPDLCRDISFIVSWQNASLFIEVKS